MKPFSFQSVFIMMSVRGGINLMNFKLKNNLDFDTLFKEYNAYVFKIVINESNNKLSKEDIEETVSDVFFLLWKNYGKIKNDQKVKSYLGKIAKNTARNKLRSLKKISLSFDDNIFSDSQGNMDKSDIKDQINLIHEALQAMDKIDKKLFLLYYYENKKIKEIAMFENMKVASVKTRLHRTRKKLKKILERKGFKI